MIKTIDQNAKIIQYYTGGVKSVFPAGSVSLMEMLELIREPDPLMEKIRATKDKKIRDLLKQKLMYFTPCVHLAPGNRSYKGIKYFTGVMMIDFDGLPNQDAIHLKKYLFQEYEEIMAVWMSSSGKGVRGLLAIPQVDTVDEFKGYFRAIRQELDGIIGFDIAPQNPVLPLYRSYDPDILIREEPFIYLDWKEAPPEKQQWEKGFKRIDGVVAKIMRQEAIDMVKRNIGNITDNGHPQVRSTAYTLGGYVGAGVISHQEAVDCITDMIDNNNYLQKALKSYHRTAEHMIREGIKNPL